MIQFDAKKIKSFLPLVMVGFFMLISGNWPFLIMIVVLGLFSFSLYRKLKGGTVGGDIFQESKSFFNNNFKQNNMNETVRDAIIDGGGGKFFKTRQHNCSTGNHSFYVGNGDWRGADWGGFGFWKSEGC